MKDRHYPIAEPDLGRQELRNVQVAMRSGWISSKGRFVGEFESSFARYIGSKHAVATSNGTTALHLALAALNIGRGDEVIVPDLTFAATINAVIYTGARPVMVDVDPEYWCLDVAKTGRSITQHTRAIVPVHLYGHPCDLGPLMEIADTQGIHLVEDCAEAHGAEYRGKKVGSLGHISCFSFYANKIVTTGEGGMCVTNDDELADKMRMLRDHGMSREKTYWHEMVGFNYRMTNLQAAIGAAQLQRISEFIEKKRRIARLYAEELSPARDMVIRPEMPWAKCVYWLFSILVDEVPTHTSRDMLLERLATQGIETRRLFCPLHKMPPYQKYADSDYTASSDISRRGLSLPSSTRLGKKDIAFITRKVKEYLQ